MTPLIKQKHNIIFHASGRLELTKKVTEKLNLKCGDYINFKTDNDELYIFKSTYGVKLRSTRQRPDQGFLRGYCKALCVRILNKEKIAKFRVGDEVVLEDETMLPIINRINYAEQD